MGPGQPFCTNYPAYYENTGVSTFRGGEQVLNTSSDTDSWLVKGKFNFLDDHSVEFSHTGYRSNFGEIRPSLLSSTMGMQSTQKWPSRAEVDRYSVRHRWNPAENDLIDLKTNLWLSNFKRRYGTTASASATKKLGLPSPSDARILVGSDTTQWGADVTNTSLFDIGVLGGLTLDYGASYITEDTKPTDLTRKLEGQYLPPNGTRGEWHLFSNGKLKVNEWLSFDGGLRFTSFKADDRSVVGEIPFKQYGDQ